MTVVRLRYWLAITLPISLLLGLLAWWALHVQRDEAMAGTVSGLQTQLLAAKNRMQDWEQQQLNRLFNLTDRNDVFVWGLSRLHPDSAVSQLTQAQLRTIYRAAGYQGHVLFDVNQQVVDSSADRDEEAQLILAAMAPTLSQTLSVGMAISAPLPSPMPLAENERLLPAGSLVQYVCTRLETERRTRGGICLRLETRSGLSALLRHWQSDPNNELYAVDAEGLIVTPTRVLQAEAPGALAAMFGDWRDSAEREALIDYRDAASVGAIAWDETLQLGLVLQRDLDQLPGNDGLAHPVIALIVAAFAQFSLLLLAGYRQQRRQAGQDRLYRELLSNLPLRLRVRDCSGHVLIDNFTNEEGLQLPEYLPLDQPEPPPGLSPISERAWRGLRQVLATGEPLEIAVEQEAPNRPDYRAYRQVFFPIHTHASGDTVGALGSLLIDETDLRRTTHALQALSEDLDGQVRQRTAQLASAMEQAEQAAQAKVDFVTHISHEIRSPLNAVIGLSHLARRACTEPRLDGYLDKILKSGEHLLEIVDDLLDYSKLDAGQMPIEQVPFVPGLLVQNVVDMIWERAADKQLQVGVEIDPRLPAELCGDPLRLAQILINLASNAVKFTAQGRIDLRMRQVAVRDGAVRVRCEVQDSGIGIAEQHLSELFRPFRQLTSATARQHGGTGLGLAICARLAKLMGGELSVSSQLGVGSLFALELDVPTVPASQPHAQRPVPPVRRAAAHVLLVEDEPLNREVACELLQALGVRVSLAGDGVEALERLHAHADIDLVLMDVQMPHMDGLEATRRLRARWPDLPVIALTGNLFEAERELCRQAGMDDLLGKPFDPARLAALLDKWLPAAPQAAERPADAPLTPISGLDQVAALERLLGNRALYRKLLHGFLQESRDIPHLLRRLLDEQRLEEGEQQMHRFKSLAAALGAVELQRLSGELEHALRHGEPPGARLDAFEAEFARIYQAVQQQLAADRVS